MDKDIKKLEKILWLVFMTELVISSLNKIILQEIADYYGTGDTWSWTVAGKILLIIGVIWTTIRSRKEIMSAIQWLKWKLRKRPQ